MLSSPSSRPRIRWIWARSLGTAPGLRAAWRPTCTSLSRKTPGTIRSLKRKLVFGQSVPVDPGLRTDMRSA